MIMKREKEVIHIAIAHHPLLKARPSFPNSDRPPFLVTPPVYWAGCSMVQNTPLVSLGHLFHLCSLSVSFEYLLTGRA